MKILARLWFHVLRFCDEVAPGWSMPASRIAPPQEGDIRHVSAESLNYWLTDERCRRGREAGHRASRGPARCSSWQLLGQVAIMGRRCRLRGRP